MKYITFCMTVFTFLILLISISFADEVITNNKKIDREKIFSLPISYVHIGKSVFAPAYYEGASRRAYIWKGIRLDIVNTPDIGKISHRTAVFDVDRDNLKIEYLYPEVKFRNQEGKIYLGYYDWSRKIFYKWKYVSFDEGAIPKRFKEKIYTEHPEVYGIHKEVEIDIPDYFWDSIFSK